MNLALDREAPHIFLFFFLNLVSKHYLFTGSVSVTRNFFFLSLWFVNALVGAPERSEANIVEHESQFRWYWIFRLFSHVRYQFSNITPDICVGWTCSRVYHILMIDRNIKIYARPIIFLSKYFTSSLSYETDRWTWTIIFKMCA